MGRIRLRPFLAFLILALAGCGRDALEPAPSAVPAHVADKPEGRPVDRGRAIYTRGESLSGRPITARIGEGPAVPATSLACAQCHGGDGRSRPEGGVTPSDITWANLTRPYGVSHPGGRRHPAYTAALFGRAVTMGWDPAGQTLSPVMPRYQMSAEDMADLIAYIRQIAADAPGVTESSIRIGVALLTLGPTAPPPSELFEDLTAHVNTINASGGIFRRRLELVIPAREGGDDREIFAAIGGVTPGGDPTSERLEAAGIPIVRVYPPPTAGWPAGRRGSFALISGHAGQVRALVRFAAESRIGADAGIVVIHAPDPGSHALAREVAAQLSQAGIKDVTVEAAPSTATGRIETQRSPVMLFVGQATGGLGKEWALGLVGQSRASSILMTEALGGRWLAAPPRALAGRLIIACPVPSCIGDRSTPSVQAMSIMVEALKAAGRELDRDAFIGAMETLVIDGHGRSPPIAFGPGRRIGLRGAAILRLSPGARSYELISPGIDPGPIADDWPVPKSRPDTD